jgi:hypothetical protein
VTTDDDILSIPRAIGQAVRLTGWQDWNSTQLVDSLPVDVTYVLTVTLGNRFPRGAGAHFWFTSELMLEVQRSISGNHRTCRISSRVTHLLLYLKNYSWSIGGIFDERNKRNVVGFIVPPA